MSTRSLNLSDDLYQYYREYAFRDEPLLQQLREQTAAMPEANMQISPEQGAFLALLVGLMQASTVVEVGTFTGYSSLCMARALPQGGQLIALDTSVEWTAIAKDYWRRADVADRVELRLGDAKQSLRQLLDEGKAGAVDLIFVDADKESYPQYFELGLSLLKPNGLLVFDNVLWGGSVADSGNREATTESIRTLNRLVKEDPRVELCMLPLSDGVTLARKC